MKKLLFSLVFICFSLLSFGQAFDSAVGLRLGYPASISYKKFFNESAAGEVYGGFRGVGGTTWFSAHAAYQIHQDLTIEGIDQLQWYYGAGAGINSIGSNYRGGATFLSVSGYIGLSYVFEDIPLNVSIDWIPSFFIGGNLGINNFGSGYGALAARYIL